MTQAKLQVFTLNEIGGRENLEDAVAPKKYQSEKDLPVFIVCDGVGGSSKGEVASNLAVDCLYKELSLKYNVITTLNEFQKAVNEGFNNFQTQLKSFIKENPTCASSSTTLTLVMIKNNCAYLAWCGDSKIYHIRDHKPIFRSKDHSLVQELIDKSIITEEEALRHPQKNVITRCLSTHTKFNDISYHFIENIQTNDWFMLFTDGLAEKFTEDKFSSVINEDNLNKDIAEIINNICVNRTNDNYSMQLIHYSNGIIGKKNFINKIILLALSIIIIGVLLFFGKNIFFSDKNQEKKQILIDTNNIKTSDTVNKDTTSSKFITIPQIKVKKPEDIVKKSEKKSTIQNDSLNTKIDSTKSVN